MTDEQPFEPIRLTGVIEQEIGRPRNDGSPGSALYSVPFRLSRTPPPGWSPFFVESWDHPPRWTTMHRPGIAEARGDRVILTRTSIKEVEDVHLETLKLAIDEANSRYSAHEAAERRRAERARQQGEQHDAHVRGLARRLKFD